MITDIFIMDVAGAEILLEFIITVFYVSFVDSEPSKCQDFLNSSDCGLSPTTVFTYDNSKEACHHATWFGCPTTNKFDDEHQCLTTCAKHVDVKSTRIQKSEIVKAKCNVLLNTNRCTKQMKQVYTYNDIKRACVTALWFGCPSENLFYDISACHRSCHDKNDNSINDKTEESNIIKFPNEDNKIEISKDINDKAYFIYKLQEANKQAGKREKEDVDFMLELQKKYNVF